MFVTRAFVEGDLAGVKALVDRTIDASYTGTYPPGAIAFFKDYHSLECILNDARAGLTLVVEEDGKLIATGTLLGTNVRRMFVDPAQRGRGLGCALLSSLERHARALGLTALDLSASLPAHGFYLHYGYNTDSEECDVVTGGDMLRYYEMSKKLAP